MGFGGLANVGSCALLALVLGDKLYVANLGDSKGVLFEEKNEKIELTDLNSQMNANNPEEQKWLTLQFPNDKDIFMCKN